MHRFRTLMFFAALTMMPVSARADDEAAALEKGKALYDEAAVLLDAKKFNEACAKLQEAIQLVPVAVGARLALGECEEGRGRLASALAAYRKAESLATAAGQGDRQELARLRAQAIEARVPSLEIQLPPADAALEGLVIALDEKPLTAPERATAIPVDPGPHKVRATAKGRAPFEVTTTLKEGQKGVVTITLLPEALAAPTASAGPGPSASGGASTGMSPLRIAGIAAGVAGVVGVGIGAAMGGVAMSKNDESFAAGCVKGGSCTPDGTVARQAAYDAAAVSTGAFIGGGVLLAAGVVLFLVAPSGPAPAKAAGLPAGIRPSEAAVVVGPNGISLRGRF